MAAEIRRRIVTGEYSPGDRLPTFQEIEATFSVSRGVAQLAVQRLKDDGFINPETRQGLFVVPNPPHLRRYALIFPVTHADPAWSRFDEVLVRQARVFEQATGREFVVFAGTEDHRESAKLLSRLRREVARDLLAGLIFMPGSFELAKHKPFDSPNLPKSYLFHRPGYGVGPIVSGDGQMFFDKAFQHLLSKGCKRGAVIRVEGAYSGITETTLNSYGLECKPQWIQTVARGDHVVLNMLVALLMDYRPEERPDGLFICDDNLTDHIVSAVVGAGLQVGRDVHIVSHVNWPALSPCVLPIRRLGFHIGQLLSRSIETIDAQRRGETPPAVQSVPAVFEDELDPAWNQAPPVTDFHRA